MLVSIVHAQDAAYRYEKGKEYKYLIEQTNLQLQEVSGQTMTTNSEATISVVYTVLDVLDNGNLKMKATLDNALLISEGPNGSQTLGGDMSGKSIVFEITNSGRMVEIDSSIRQIDSDGVVILIGTTSIFPRLDATKLGEGSSWSSSEADTTGEGEYVIIEETERNYSIKGKKTVNGIECYEISVNSEAERDGKMSRGDNEMMVSGTRNGEGTIMYGIEQGVLVSLTSEMNMDQTVVLPSNNMRIPITGTQNVKIELISK
jgi:hypothetical protein